MERPIIDVAIRDFLENIDGKPATKGTYKRALIVFGKWLFLNNLKYNQVALKDIIKFKSAILEKNQPRTINLYLSVIKNFYNYLSDSGIIQIKISGVKKEPVRKGFKRLPLTVDQVQELLSRINTETEIGRRDYTLISLMVNSGLRRGEVSHIDTSDLFKRGKVSGLMILRKGHYLKDTHKILSPDIYQLLIELAGENINNPGQPLFTTCTPGMEKRRLSAFQISQVVKKHLKAIGLTDKLWSAHSLRHTTGTVMAMQGKDIYTICEYLGHCSIATTQLYIQMVKEVKSWNSDEANNLSSLFKKKEENEENAS